MAKVVAIEKNSVAEELGIEVGDELLGFDGQPIVDILDYLYYDGQENFVMNMRAKQGDIVDMDIEKYENETLGLSLDESVDLEPIRCQNKCMFCFVDQLPCGMRDTLYVKDDDYRLSFVSGNYVTLTNVGEKELQRIAKLHLSPLYVSVHCFDRDTKTKLIANPHGAELFEKMQFLAEHGITMHGQIVMCKGLNDGAKLLQTLTELHKLSPQVKTVAVIPVGLTRYREKLAPLEQIDKETASDTIDLVEKFNKSVGGEFCFCSDEFYIKADRELPSYTSYGAFDQIENGVGLCAEFVSEFDSELAKAKRNARACDIAFVTGQSFKNILAEQLAKMSNKFPNVNARVVDIVNDHFGHSITVAGLITAKDIINQAKNMPSHTVIPNNMLREFTTTFLDGMSVAELEKQLNTHIHICGTGGELIKITREVLQNV
ncbi:MAG: DUF512 domain-containing protein [Clostridia bacterium]